MEREKVIRKRSGFTLVEVAAVAALSGLVFVAIAAAVLPLASYLRQDQQELTLTDELCIGLEQIKRDALQASDFTLPAGDPGPQLTLAIKDFIADSTTYIYYDGTGSTLTRKVGVGTAFTILDNLNSVVFASTPGPGNAQNVFTASLTGVDGSGRAIKKSATIMLRCRDSLRP